MLTTGTAPFLIRHPPVHPNHPRKRKENVTEVQAQIKFLQREGDGNLGPLLVPKIQVLEHIIQVEGPTQRNPGNISVLPKNQSVETDHVLPHQKTTTFQVTRKSTEICQTRTKKNKQKTRENQQETQQKV